MTASQQSYVTIIGTGSWGTTLGLVIARNGTLVRLWTRTEQEAQDFLSDGENRRFLPGYPFPPTIKVTSSLEEALAPGCQMIIFASPSSKMRQSLQAARPYYENLPHKPLALSAAKGLEMD